MPRYRDSMAVALSAGCAVCGDPRGFLMAVHHKHRNHSDSRPSQMDSLCPRCHVVRHLRWSDSGWVQDTKALTPGLIVKYLDMDTQTLHFPKTDRQKSLARLRDFYLIHLCEDQEVGTEFDREILGFLDSLDQRQEGVQIDLEALWG